VIAVKFDGHFLNVYQWLVVINQHTQFKLIYELVDKVSNGSFQHENNSFLLTEVIGFFSWKGNVMFFYITQNKQTWGMTQENS
jgi:hypothetical protein